MKFKLLPDGSIEADSIEAILALRAGLLGNTPSTATISHSAPAAPVVTTPAAPAAKPTPWDKFIENVSGEGRFLQRRLLLALKAGGGTPLSLDELRMALKVETNNAIGGTVAGVVKNAKRAGIESVQILARDATGGFRPGPLLAQRDLPFTG